MKPAKQIPHKRKKEVFERDGGICQYCGRMGADFHHIIGAGMGRRRNHSLENLITLCNICHTLAHTDIETKKWCISWSLRKHGDRVLEIYDERWLHE